MLYLYQVEQMVSSEQLNVTAEEEVFSAVIQWLQFNEEERKDAVSRVRTLLCAQELLWFHCKEF